MSETTGIQVWSMRAGFLLLALVILLGNLLPLQTMARGWAGPDLLFCFALAWSHRRPDVMTLGLLAVVFFTADLLLSRPPGLAAAFMLIACNDMQIRARRVRDGGFASEWARVVFLIVAVALAYRITLALFLLPVPPVAITVYQVVATALVYPLVVAISVFVFGLRQTAVVEEPYGNRL